MSSFYKRKGTLMLTSCRKPPGVAASFPQNTCCLWFCHMKAISTNPSQSTSGEPPPPRPLQPQYCTPGPAGRPHRYSSAGSLRPPSCWKPLKAGSGGLGAARPGASSEKEGAQGDSRALLQWAPPPRTWPPSLRPLPLAPCPSPSHFQPPLPATAQEQLWEPVAGALAEPGRRDQLRSFPRNGPHSTPKLRGLGKAAPASVYKSFPKPPWNVKQR